MAVREYKEFECDRCGEISLANKDVEKPGGWKNVAVPAKERAIFSAKETIVLTNKLLCDKCRREYEIFKTKEHERTISWFNDIAKMDGKDGGADNGE